MAGIFEPIKMPMNAMDAFWKGMNNSQSMFDSFMRNKMTPYQIKLLEAQAEEAKGKAYGERMAGQHFQNLTDPTQQSQPSEEPLTGTQTLGGFDKNGSQVNYNTATTPVSNSMQSQSGADNSAYPEPNSQPTPGQTYRNSMNQPDDTHALTTMPPESQTQAKADLPAGIGQEKIIVAGDPSKYPLDEAAKRGESMNYHGVDIKPTIDEKTENGYTTKRHPSGKVTISRSIGETEAEKGNRVVSEKKQEDENSANIEVAKDFEKENVKSYQNGVTAKNDIDALQDTISQPHYKNIAGSLEGYALNAHPLGIPVGAILAKVAPGKFTPEDLDLIGTTNTQMGNVVLNVGSQFKGPFKQLINGLINGMKPNVNDPIEVQEGKIRALKVANELGQQQTVLYDKYLKKTGGNAIKAMEMTSKELPYKKIKEEIESARKSKEGDYKMINGVLHKRKK